MDYLISAVIGYLLGTFPTAYIVLKKSNGLDITKNGTGNVGAMNSFEVTNSKFIGILVLLIDALKGLLSVYLVLIFLPVDFVYPSLALLFAVFSHCYNPWLKFKGGRGLSTAAGGSLLLFPFMLIVWAIVWSIIYLFKRDIILANVWANIMSLILIFSSINIAFKYSYPTPDSHSTLILFTSGLLFLIFIKHIDPLKDLLKNKKILYKGKANE